MVSLAVSYPFWLHLFNLRKNGYENDNLQSQHSISNTILTIHIWEKMNCTAQKMKFSIKDFFSECDQIRSFLRIWSHLLKKSLMENFIFLCSE